MYIIKNVLAPFKIYYKQAFAHVTFRIRTKMSEPIFKRREKLSIAYLEQPYLSKSLGKS